MVGLLVLDTIRMNQSRTSRNQKGSGFRRSEGAALFRPTTALAAKLLELEHKVSGHDQAIAGLIDASRQLMMPATGKSRPIGFTADIETKRK